MRRRARTRGYRMLEDVLASSDPNVFKGLYRCSHNIIELQKVAELLASTRSDKDLRSLFSNFADVPPRTKLCIL